MSGNNLVTDVTRSGVFCPCATVAGVDSEVADAWVVTREGRTEVEVEVRLGPRTLDGRLSRAELERVRSILDAAVAAEKAGTYSRIKLGAALREAIGRDPLGSPGRGRRDRLWPVWAALSYLVLGAGFGVRHLDDWWQLCGWGVAAVAVTELVRRARRWHGERLR